MSVKQGMLFIRIGAVVAVVTPLAIVFVRYLEGF